MCNAYPQQNGVAGDTYAIATNVAILLQGLPHPVRLGFVRAARTFAWFGRGAGPDRRRGGPDDGGVPDHWRDGPGGAELGDAGGGGQGAA